MHKQEARFRPIRQSKLIEVSRVRVKRFPGLNEKRSPSLALFPMLTRHLEDVQPGAPPGIKLYAGRSDRRGAGGYPLSQSRVAAAG